MHSARSLPFGRVGYNLPPSPPTRKGTNIVNAAFWTIIVGISAGLYGGDKVWRDGQRHHAAVVAAHDRIDTLAGDKLAPYNYDARLETDYRRQVVGIQYDMPGRIEGNRAIPGYYRNCYLHYMLTTLADGTIQLDLDKASENCTTTPLPPPTGSDNG